MFTKCIRTSQAEKDIFFYGLRFDASSKIIIFGVIRNLLINERNRKVAPRILVFFSHGPQQLHHQNYLLCNLFPIEAKN
jgi:hypothetical protein